MAKAAYPLNGICPYFTMFPLEFPLSVLRNRAKQGDSLLDPFCGRGTSNFAARILGLPSVGIDSSSVAVAITEAKLVSVHPSDIVNTAISILDDRDPNVIPSGDFWNLAYHPDVLKSLCKLREAFLEDCSSPSRKALRGIILGALHGPRQKTIQSYLSNQCLRTYAPKPRYAVSYWKKNGSLPERVDILDVIEKRAHRYYQTDYHSSGRVCNGDSRDSESFNEICMGRKFNWIVTSPPYYGMRTYVPDQWLRNWFLGGSDSVDYSNTGQISHSSKESFSDDLKYVWINCKSVATDDADLVIRFGGISTRSVCPRNIIEKSVSGSGWTIYRIRKAGTAAKGKRQADTFLRNKTKPIEEYDIWLK